MERPDPSVHYRIDMRRRGRLRHLTRREMTLPKALAHARRESATGHWEKVTVTRVHYAKEGLALGELLHTFRQARTQSEEERFLAYQAEVNPVLLSIEIE